jgi:predicted ATPase/DNA-binding winged helix-turn-helix (wHTH) protein
VLCAAQGFRANDTTLSIIAMNPQSGTSGIIKFGRFKVLSHRRELLVDGRPIELGARAFDVLMALIEARGAVLTKDELMSRVWPGRIVEENNLQAQISALRRAFAEQRDLIRTVAGRGYLFTGEIRATTTEGLVASPHSPTNLPERASELIGRDAEMGELLNLVSAHRLVTLIGAGGIGKTRLALEVARSLVPRFADGAWVAELAPLSDPGLVPATIAAALGLTLAGGTVSLERVAAALGTKQILLVLDNCEHLIEIAARMAEMLLRASSGVSLIATSREALRVEGERSYRVPPLSVPPEVADGTADPLRAGAVRLFVARARESSPGFAPDDRVATIVGAICRRLDGIPLAIELAAARTAALGIDDLAARLDDRFRILTAGLRTALPRHQTLRAALDWSYELLPESERVVLRRLAVFAGSFALESASEVVAGDGITTPDVVDRVANLVAKSLVTADTGGAGVVACRLLDTTRAYALEKLIESGEHDQLARRHAEYYRAFFERAEAEWDTQPTTEWLAAYRSSIYDVRSALDWAFSPRGDAAIGLTLTVAAVPLWFQLSLIDEARKRLERALATLEHGSSPGAHRRMQLYWALGWSLMYTAGPTRETGAAWTTALELAEGLGDTDYRLRALWGLWAGRINNGEFTAARAFAERFCSVAESTADPNDFAVGERMVGVSLHFLGDQAGARRHIEHMLNRYVTPIRRSDVVRFQFDQRVTARITLARVLWLQGFADRAMRAVESNIDEALSINHTLSLCNTLAQAACPVALLAGDLAAADRFVAMFLHHTAGLALDVWHTYGRCFRGMLLIERGRLDIGLPLLRAAIDELREARFVQYHTTFIATLAEGYAEASRFAEGLAAIDEALAQAERNDERWSIAELLRIKGELVLLKGAPNAPRAAEELFLESIDSGRRQGALSWELRSAMSLARLWHAQARTIESRELLTPVHARFTEGFGTADLQAAKTLIEAFG